MTSVSCVLLGVAEVRVPVKRLPQEVLMKVANVADWAVVYEGHTSGGDEEVLEDRKKFIGEVDNYYSLREVEVRVEEEECHILHGSQTVMQHRTKDVAIVTPTKENLLRMVYISRSDSFGRAAVVLQMKSRQTMEELLALFPGARHPTAAPVSAPISVPGSNGLQQHNIKEPKASLGRSMGKKLTSMLMAPFSSGSALATSTSPRKSPLPTRRVAKIPERVISQDSDASSDSEDDEEDSVCDDADSNKSTGELYKDMGLDATVQERLYDQNADAVSRTSDSSLETNAIIIEAELKFFMETDKTFLECLQSLGEDREKLASADTPHFIRGKVILLFTQVKELTRLHTELHAAFEESDGNLKCLGEAIISHQQDYENYVYFMENIPVVDSILETHRDYMKAHLPELPEKLRKPRMRLHYYVLTLETLYKKSSCPEDKKALQKAIDVLKIPLKKADSKLFLGAVTGSPFDLSNFGNLLRHNDLTLRRGGDLPRRVYHVLMLKTLILLTIRDGRNYSYVTSFRMDQVGLGSQERGLILNLRVRNGPRGQTVVHIFKAKNINTQQQWIKDLKGLVKVRSRSSTPRNSYVEGDPETRISGKRSKVSRGQSVEKLIWQVSTTALSDSDVLDEGERLSRSESNDLKSGRRTAIRKNPSASGRNRPVMRQQSGYSSDGEGSWSKRRMMDQSSPLNVWTLFPYLKDFYYQKGDFLKAFDCPLDLKEPEYIERLREVFGAFLSEELPKPPQCITAVLRHIFEFHNKVFIPMLDSVSSVTEISQCFVDCSEKVIELYSRYFIYLTRFYAQLQYDNLLNSLLLPMDQFILYTRILSTYERQAQDVIPPVQAALSMLRECVSSANIHLLTEAVEGAPFDLGEHGPVLLEGPAKVRWTGIMIRQDYHLVLLDTMLLLLEPHPNFYRYVDALRMDTVGLGPESDNYSFQLEVRMAATKTLLYVFKTPSHEAKKKWLKKIIGLLNLQVEKLKEKQKRRLGTSRGELMAVGDAAKPLYSTEKPPSLETEQPPLETEL